MFTTAFAFFSPRAVNVNNTPFLSVLPCAFRNSDELFCLVQVAAGGGSSVTLDNCVSGGAKDFYGLGVTSEGTDVVARDCQFLDNQR